MTKAKKEFVIHPIKKIYQVGFMHTWICQIEDKTPELLILFRNGFFTQQQKRFFFNSYLQFFV